LNKQNFDADQFAYLTGQSSTQAILTVVENTKMVNSLEQTFMILLMPLAAWIVNAYLKRFVRISTQEGSFSFT